MGINWIDKGYWHIHGKQCILYLSTRPSYCDRGNYLVQLDAHGDFVLEVDHQDGFPRYYFDFDAACAEIIAWLKTRKQFVENVSVWVPDVGSPDGSCCDIPEIGRKCA